jgi:hypothetical protein
MVSDKFYLLCQLLTDIWEYLYVSSSYDESMKKTAIM